MLNFANQHSRTQYNRLRRFYQARIEKTSKQISTLRTAIWFLDTGDNKRWKLQHEVREHLDSIERFKRFVYLEDYAVNTDSEVNVFASEGDFSGFDVAFMKPVYNEFGHEIEKKHWFNGGFINHGTIRNPSWSLHT